MTELRHPLTWASPRPLWRGAASPGRAPTILRFASDEFMEQLLGLLATDPGRLSAHVARHETWRTPPSELATEDMVERVPLPGPVRKARLATRLARAPQPIAPPDKEAPRLKLYQPAHQRYYVVAGTLACAVPGLPDRKLGGGHEQVAFVLRRLLTAAAGSDAKAPLVEYAFVKDGEGARWQRVSEGGEAVLGAGEERLPLFPLAHEEGGGLRRSMWGGLVPVGRREEYLSARVSRTVQRLAAGQAAALAGAPPAPARNSKLGRSVEFKIDFADPWKALIQSAEKAAAEIKADTKDKDSTPVSRQAQLRSRNLQYQMQSWLLLADLYAFFQRHLKPVADALRFKNPEELRDYPLYLYNWLAQEAPGTEQAKLANGFLPPDPAPDPSVSPQLPYVRSLGEALHRISAEGVMAGLEKVETLYENKAKSAADWPRFHFLLAGIGSDGAGTADQIEALGPFLRLSGLFDQTAPDAELGALTAKMTEPTAATESDLSLVDKLTVLVARALETGDDSKARALPFAQQLSQTIQDTVGDAGLFRIRFVHLNEDCGPLHPPTLSEPTETFELASFFDSDAPARPVRISLPMDTSPAGLRKHSRGTAFVLSNMLCGQVQRAKGLGLIDLIRHVLPWPLHKELSLGDGGGCKQQDGTDIGMICSLSIPIVTICALILLMIIVSLLDFVFRWLPWLMFCFPVPKLKGKP